MLRHEHTQQMASLLKGVPWLDRVVTWRDGEGEQARDWDQQIELMELPRAFRTTLSTIPAETPYLRVSDSYRERDSRRFGRRDAPRAGILWRSGDWDRARDVPLGELRPLVETPGMEFYSFQRGPGRDELAALGLGNGIRDISGDSPDVAHFATDLLHMDLLITVDTMAAHLAGALGRPVWVLLPYRADWRWRLERSDSPWYATMRLFRQNVQGDWRTPVEGGGRVTEAGPQAQAGAGLARLITCRYRSM